MRPLYTILGLAFGIVGVVLAGVVLARAGDVIAGRTRLGRVWVGSVFLALATSLPELVTGVSAVRIGAPEIAAGELFGSNMANMLILAALNLLPGAAVFRRADLDHVLYAAHAVVLTAVAATFVLVDPLFSIGPFGSGSLVLVLIYLLGTRAIFHQSAPVPWADDVYFSRDPGGGEEAGEASGEAGDRAVAELRRALVHFAGGSLLVLASGPLLALSADSAAELTGIAESFLGAVLVGVATSLPELVTSVAAIRIRAFDLAVGNLFGSNTVNMLMFAPMDAAGTQPLFGVVSRAHVIMGLASIVMMALGMAAITHRSEGRLSLQEPGSLLMILVYAAGMAMVFAWGGP